jgi:broad specificity phosphatase PhoE
MKPSEFLETLDSHGIYAAAVLVDLDEEHRATVPVFSHGATVRAIRDRGLGGHLESDIGDRLIYGYTSASALARSLLKVAPGDRFLGRGSAFRANLAGLKDAGY